MAVSMNRSISFVIPSMDEELSLPELHERILSTCEQKELDAQIIFVDDGSTQIDLGPSCKL